MQKRYKIYDDERELKKLEVELAKEFNVPYVKCVYDGCCSHISYTEELEYRRKEGILRKNEYVINYEIYNTKKDYADIYTGGVDGEIYELIYSTNGKYITVKDY